MKKYILYNHETDTFLHEAEMTNEQATLANLRLMKEKSPVRWLLVTPALMDEVED